MKILVTNDDGVDAAGIKALVEQLKNEHEVWILAPDRERSGASHSVNLRDPGKIVECGPQEYSCSGTPADCVMMAYLGALPFKPELVIAGINRGPNLGTDILYSGTCAAARQASLYSLPGIAVSCAIRQGPFRYGAAAAFVRKNLKKLVEACLPSAFININAPSTEDQNLEGLWASVSIRHYHDEIRPFKAPDGGIYCFLEPGLTETIGGEFSDEAIVARGLVAISSILIHPQITVEDTVGKAFR